ncbi:endonuclease domain-containing protein [Agromyces sp. CCNWLW203]|uniref:endonuclease domain-containing protein n=1 Tax=Agromyces sp. CCNWLW203 TaxID=3112842 RepID=UPI002F96E3B6
MLDDTAFEQLLERLPATTRAIAVRSDAGSQSIAETVAREGLRAAGIQVRTQVPLPGGFFADLLIGDRFVFEADGEGPHTAPGAFDRDRARAGWLKAIGYTYVSFSHSQILHEWDMVLDVVRMLMRRGLHEWG